MASKLRSRGKPGVWYLPYRNESGQLTEQRFVARTKGEANKNAAEWLQKQERVRLGLDAVLEHLTMAEAFQRYSETACKKKGWGSEVGRWNNHILPALGRKMLHQVRPHDIDVLLLAKGSDLAEGTVFQLRAHLCALFTWAIRKAHVLRGENPAHLSTPIKLPEAKPKALADGQLSAIISAAPDEQVRLLLITAALTGMRKGELFGLEWESVDEAHSTITVCKSYQGDTKAGRSRPVPIPAGLLPFFSWARKNATSRYVFPREDGSPRTHNFNAANTLRQCLIRAGLVAGWSLTCIPRKGGQPGSKNSRAKLNEEQVARIRALADKGSSEYDLAEKFKVSRRAVHFILTGKTWGKPKSPGGCGYTTTAAENSLQLCPTCGAPMFAKVIPLDFSFKDLRSTFVTRTMEGSGDERSAQLIAGHQDPATTRRHYAVSRIDHLKEAVAKTAPLALPNSPNTLPTNSNAHQRQPTLNDVNQPT